jgi:glycosyltransferase involved in cell wall biosynthesis
MYPEFSYTRCTFAGLDHPLRYVRASYVITGTEEGKRQIAAMYGVYEPKIRVIPFPTPVLPDADGQSAPSFHFPNNAPYVFYPARFWPHKNHVVAVAALKALREKFNCTVNLVFTGADEGNWGYVLEFAQSLGVDEQIAYLGKVSDAELVALYKGAFALVFVAAVGPDNLPPLEAMSLGCPAIVADVPGAREQLADACLYFPPMDERALAQQLLSLIREPSLRASLVAKGLARAQRWTVDDYAAAVMAIFDEFSLIRRAWGPHDASFT